MRTQKDRMVNQKLYIADDTELRQARKRAKMLIRKFNETDEEHEKDRLQLIKKLFQDTGENCYIEPPFRADYGFNISVGENFYANYDCIFIDVAPIKIGNHVLFGPRVGLYTAGHPIDPVIRNQGFEYGKSISIGDNVWIGGNVVINPGVTIGSNVVIGSGSIVTHNIPSDVVAVGNPCHVLRKINADDQKD
ncbi:sugar O-acetyltransferase [Oenococcus sicerae]|uniref:sugar O-acetyltransferase n=1 Tax=Oenococcus sicerae TaxID=2203724 RepID=UPI0010B06394|nr:Maltose O-acetyltransferase [Oenococcus sicerae]